MPGMHPSDARNSKNVSLFPVDLTREEYDRRLSEALSSGCSVDEALTLRAWTKVAGEKKKGRLYGAGNLAGNYRKGVATTLKLTLNAGEGSCRQPELTPEMRDMITRLTQEQLAAQMQTQQELIQKVVRKQQEFLDSQLDTFRQEQGWNRNEQGVGQHSRSRQNVRAPPVCDDDADDPYEVYGEAKMMMMMTGSRWMIDAYDACCVFSLLLCYGLYDFGRGSAPRFSARGVAPGKVSAISAFASASAPGFFRHKCRVSHGFCPFDRDFAPGKRATWHDWMVHIWVCHGKIMARSRRNVARCRQIRYSTVLSPAPLWHDGAKVVPDEYDDRTFCVYTMDASTVFGVAAFSLLLLSQTVRNTVTSCLCCGKGLISGCSTICAKHSHLASELISEEEFSEKKKTQFNPLLVFFSPSGLDFADEDEDWFGRDEEED
ncbi:hypothetical protein MTR_8g027455 [Medicago truncatula]|uniref:Uncharacterized protein n=1 Tax=Medicago truncatula TaxID=3880 RepID=A0A072TN33_MEDTR|nr:hypothetical protein MTR_8g027455 [Medicago truncatula]